MGRKRKHPDWLPMRVYRGRSSYEFRPKSGGTIKLGRLKRDELGCFIEDDAVKQRVLRAHAQALAEGVTEKTVHWLINSYFNSKQFKQLSSSTQSLYRLLSDKYVQPVFGGMKPKSVTPLHIRSFMDKLGESLEPTANRCHTFLSTLFSWGYERNHIDRNPAKGIKKFHEKPRDRYIEDWEYELVYKIAQESAYPWIAPMMEFAYLCRMRANEIRALTKDHIKSEGVFVERSKGSKNEITEWSSRLKLAFSDAESLIQLKSCSLLFPSASGGVIPKTSFDSAWRRVRKSAMDHGLTHSFNFHDIKAKGITDHENKSGGHRSYKMELIYDRLPSVVSSTR